MASAAKSTITVDGKSLSIADLTRIARDPRVKVAIGPAAMRRVRKCRDLIEKAVRAYRDACIRIERGEANVKLPSVYGVTTGFGEFKDIAVPYDDLVRLQENILLSHACGVGDTPDPDNPANYYPADVVRAALLIRLNSALKGNSGVRPALVECIAEMLNRGIVPLVPTRGSVGSSGDLCPLAHTFVILLGRRSSGRFRIVRTPEDVASPSAADSRNWRPAAEIERALGLSYKALAFDADGGGEPARIDVKEGLALTNGASYSAAMLALAVHDAEILATSADVAAAMTLEALLGRRRAFDPAVGDARAMRGHRDSAANMLKLLEESDLADRTSAVQDAYSLRCVPQVHGASRDAIAYARMVAESEINAATDNPLFFPGSTPCDWAARLARGDDPASLGDGNAYSAGNFHGQPIGLAADFLGIAVAELADISERRTQMLLDKNHNNGLPANLIPNRGVNSGLMIAQYCAASLVSENKVLAHPSSVDSIPTSANSEDHVAMATTAARKLRTILSNSQAAVAIELLSAAQAIDWRLFQREQDGPARRKERIAAHNPSQPDKKIESATREYEAFCDTMKRRRPRERSTALGRGTRAAYLLLREHLEPMLADRELAPGIHVVWQLLAAGRVVEAVQACGKGEFLVTGHSLTPHDVR